jgi:hypothetical protein
LGTQRFSQSRPFPSAVDAVQLVQVRSCTPTPASPQARMTDGGSLLSEYGAGPAQLATTPTSAFAVAVDEVGTVVEAAIVVGDAAVCWHPTTARPSAAQRAAFRSVGLMSLKTRFPRDGCMAQQGNRETVLTSPAQRADDGTGIAIRY